MTLLLALLYEAHHYAVSPALGGSSCMGSSTEAQAVAETHMHKQQY
jgi:hypothetical protein